MPIIWSPNIIQEKKIQNDWEELMEMIILGKINNITSQHGEVLMIKKKSTHKYSLTKAIGKYGQTIMTCPRSFYLRRKFTNLIINNKNNLFK